MHLLPAQGIVAYDQMEKRIVVTDGPGKPLRMIGRRGEGPGEFLSVSALAVRGDSLVVTDGGQRRASTFSLSTGRLIGTTSIPADVTWRSALVQPIALLAGGCWTGVTSRGVRRPGNPRIPWIVTRTVLRVRPGSGGLQPDSVISQGDEGQSIVPFGEMAANRVPSVVATSGRTLVAPDGNAIAAITPVLGPRSGIAVRWWASACGTPSDSVFVPIARREMTAERARELYGRMLGARQRTQATLPEAVDDAMNQTVREGGKLYEPLFAGAFFGGDGAVWIEVEGTMNLADHGRPRIWRRIGPRGVMGGPVTVPRNIRLYAADASRALGWLTGYDGASIVELGWEP
jgi:hypothetical protein